MKTLSYICVCFLLALALFAVTGCEDVKAKPATGKVEITPDSVAIRVGHAITFTASGGYEYTWSLEEESWGTLSTRSGDQTTYTSTYAPGSNTNATQILHVSSTIPGNTSTNTAPSQWSAESYITHLN
jgi:hypothetical protein